MLTLSTRGEFRDEDSILDLTHEKPYVGIIYTSNNCMALSGWCKWFTNYVREAQKKLFVLLVVPLSRGGG